MNDIFILMGRGYNTIVGIYISNKSERKEKEFIDQTNKTIIFIIDFFCSFVFFVTLFYTFVLISESEPKNNYNNYTYKYQLVEYNNK